ncbi:MAG: hypothetical protein H0W84_10420, partial [Bacteroidetes bacterium]|nr:hypothetical protein [Bacteroidota bacterium]
MIKINCFGKTFVILVILFICSRTCIAQTTFSLRADGTILKNGQPFFPIGAYNLRAESGWTKDLNDYDASGFNVFFIKNPSSTTVGNAILDAAYAKGMYVFIESDAFNGNPSTNTAIINANK